MYGVLCFVARDPVCEPQRADAIALHQNGERVDIALPGVDNELRVAHSIHVVTLHTPLGPARFQVLFVQAAGPIRRPVRHPCVGAARMTRSPMTDSFVHPEVSAELSAALAAVHSDWEQLGEDDPLWAIRTDQSRRDNEWIIEELLATGREEVAYTLSMLEQLGIGIRRGRALDFGCGVGRVTQAFAVHFEATVGVDVAESMVRRAHDLDHTGRIEYVQNTDPDLRQFGDETFDLVYSKLVLQHMPPALAAAYLGELARVVAPGGVLVVQAPAEFRGRVPLPADAYRAEVVEVRVPARVVVGGRVHVHATVRNASAHAWPGSEAELAVGAYWETIDGERVALDEGRALLADDVAAGELRRVSLAITAPPVAGRSRLVIDVVHEGVRWFAQPGDDAATVELRIAPRSFAARVRGRLARKWSARTGGTASRPNAEIHMYGLPEADVESVLTGAGLELVHRQRDHAAPGWRSATYYATR